MNRDKITQIVEAWHMKWGVHISTGGPYREEAISALIAALAEVECEECGKEYLRGGIAGAVATILRSPIPATQRKSNLRLMITLARMASVFDNQRGGQQNA